MAQTFLKLGWWGFMCVPMKTRALFKGEIIITISKNTLMKFKNIFLPNQRTNYNQTWHKASVGEGDLRFSSSYNLNNGFIFLNHILFLIIVFLIKYYYKRKITLPNL